MEKNCITPKFIININISNISSKSKIYSYKRKYKLKVYNQRRKYRLKVYSQ